MADEYEDDTLRDACGVFGCIASDKWPTQLDISHIICLGLVALQHRGQESAGIVTSLGDEFTPMSVHKGSGLVSTIFNDDILAKLKGNLGIGHTRYSTAGGTDMVNAQPFVIHTMHGLLALAHNGELKISIKKGVGLSTQSDSELITQLISLPPPDGEKNGADWTARIKNFMRMTPTAYSLVLLHGDRIFGVRDPYGNRPLCLGKLMLPGEHTKTSDKPDGWVISSESCAFQSIGAEYFREVAPGEIVELRKEGIRTLGICPRQKCGPSSHVADSILEGQMVYSVRHRCGKQLAIEAPVEADLVSTVPESATPAAIGFAQESGIPFLEVLCKNRYVGRTFIQPTTRLRQLGVGKSSDRAREDRVSSIGSPCHMGINIPTKNELVANSMNPEQLAQLVGANSLMYLTVEGLQKAVREGIKDSAPENVGHCTACLTGVYPVDLQ
uniref:Amidophosphoribosyltransferase n=2 Tax=Strigamia maritima TaxID=126957 RepID=T1IGS5_STRMM